VVGARVAPNPAPTRQPLPRQDLHVGAPQAPARPQTSMRCVVNGAPAGHEGIPQSRERCDPHRRPSAPLARRAHNDCASAARSRGSRLQSRQSRRRLGAVLLLATTSGGALLTVLVEGRRYQPAYAMPAGRGAVVTGCCVALIAAGGALALRGGTLTPWLAPVGATALLSSVISTDAERASRRNRHTRIPGDPRMWIHRRRRKCARHLGKVRPKRG
jgi:hypothetical protein